ncbi:hypothetical protein Tco_0569204 [Tanacetum coccineum]
MAYSPSSSIANSKVHTCSTECEQSYAQLKKLYDTQREQLGDAGIEIHGYTQALKKVEAQLVAHQKNQLCDPHLEEWESDNEDDEIVVKPKEVTKTVQPSFWKRLESVNARNETVRPSEKL